MKRPKKRAPQSDTTVAVGVAAKVLGVTPRTLQRLVASGVLPGPVKHGCYDLAALVPAFVELRVEQAQDEAPGPPGSPRDRWWTARAAVMELDLAERQQRLVPAAHVTRALEFLATTFRARLLALPRKLAVQLSPEDPHAIEAAIEAEARAILVELAEDRTLPDWLDDEPASAGNGAHDGADGAPAAA